MPELKFKQVTLAACAAALLFAGAQPAAAQIRGEIVGAGATALPVAVPELKRMAPSADGLAAKKFVEVLRADLELSGYFDVLNPNIYIDDPQASGTTTETINFANWRSIGALSFVRGTYTGTGTDLAVEVRFFDVADQTSAGGRRLSGPASEAAVMGHKMADAVLEFLTGIPGPFNSQIAFVSNRHGHYREVYTTTLDKEVTKITNHRTITMAPSWHPSGQALLFTSFKNKKPVLYSIDLRNGQDARLASKLGVNVGGDWSPDGSRVLLAREENGNSDIYELDPSAGRVKAVTRHWGIDVSPVWSPEGRRFAFCSSRSGTPQVYWATVGSGEVRRLTFEGDYNCSPAWSPDGRYIAFAGRRSGRFQIFVMPASGGQARQLTFSGENEDPTWAPDSRYVAYSGKRGRTKKIYMINIEGGRERQLTDGTSDDSSPSWSGRLD